MRANIFSAAGATYDLTHLNPFTIRTKEKKFGSPTFRVLVKFGCHTFTREWDEALDPPHLRYTEETEQRCFCTLRHSQSLALPAIVRQEAAKLAYFSNDRNFMLIDNLPGVAGPYAVFFNLRRADRGHNVDVAMFVVSAYEKPNLPARKQLPSIGFATLIRKTALREGITRPKK